MGRVRATAGRKRYRWVPFPFPFHATDTLDMKEEWEQAIVSASEIFLERYKVHPWYIIIPKKYRQDWMVQIANHLGLVETKSTKHYHYKMPQSFMLGAPDEEWLNRRQRIDIRSCKPLRKV